MADQIQANDAHFRLMFERSGDAILLIDTVTNQFVDYNQAALDMLRCSREELSALHPSELSPPVQEDRRDSFEKANAMIALAMANGSHRFEWVHRSPHRDDFPVEVLLTPLPTGGPPVIVAVWRDITERRRSEEALRQSQRLEAVGVLAGGIAHDFNNLLAAIGGHVDLAKLNLAEPALANQHLDLASAAVYKAASLTHHLLAYSGRGTSFVEVLDLRDLVRDMLDLLTVSVPKRATLTCDLPDRPAIIEIDRAQGHQLLLNLVTNAAEAIGDASGVLTVRVGLASLDAEEVARDFAGQRIDPGEKVTLEVVDTGRGMTPEVLVRIFDPFYSTKGPGRGLGLSALLGILRSHRAGMLIHSRPGAGTSFRVFFDASAAIPQRPVVPAVSEGAGTGMVLVVDDEEDVRETLAQLVESLGFEVIEAEDGEHAIERFATHRPRIRVVLMDLTMPRMDGHTAFLELRKLQPDVCVILCSGWAEDELMARFAEAPPAAVLPKPFGRVALRAVLARLGQMT